MQLMFNCVYPNPPLPPPPTNTPPPKKINLKRVESNQSKPISSSWGTIHVPSAKRFALLCTARCDLLMPLFRFLTHSHAQQSSQLQKAVVVMRVSHSAVHWTQLNLSWAVDLGTPLHLSSSCVPLFMEVVHLFFFTKRIAYSIPLPLRQPHSVFESWPSVCWICVCSEA